MQEVTGIILLTLHIAHRKGFSFADVLRGSFEQVKARKWGEPDAEGVVEHICDCCGERPCVCETCLKDGTLDAELEAVA
jgi:hypothetical protein